MYFFKQAHFLKIIFKRCYVGHDQITNLARPNTFICHPIDGEFTLQGLLHDTKMPKTSEMIPSHPARM